MNKTVLTSFTILCLLSTVLLMGLALNIQPAKANETSIEVSPNTTVDYGGNFTLNITVNNVKDMYAWEVGIRFRKIIKITSVVEKTNLLDSSLFWVVDPPMLGGPSYNYYKLSVGSMLVGQVSGVTGSGVVAELNFTTVYNGTTQIEVLRSTILDSTPEMREIPHTSSSCNIMVLGINEQYFLNIVPPSLGALNVTSGTYIYDNGTNVAIEATEISGAFHYFKVDNTTYTTKTITVTMNSDHEVSALFKFPVLTIYTTEPDTKIQIGYGIYFISYTTNSSGYLTLELPIGTYPLKATKWGYYSVTQSINITGDKRIDIQMNRIVYIAPTVRFTPTDVYLTPFIPQMYETITCSATTRYFSWRKDYIDFDELMEVETLVNKTGEITVIIHYATFYPIIEITSENIAVLRMNLTQIYEHYCKELYLEKVERTHFTGFKLDSNVPIVFEFGMPEPKELWKITSEGAMTQLTDWSYENSTVLLSFEPGDPTISMIFGDNYTNYHNLLADFDALNMSYISLNSSYNNLISDYDNLQSSYNQLNSSYTAFQDSYNELQSNQEAIKSELANIRNIMYIFITTTIILIATTVYFAIRKPKIKP